MTDKLYFGATARVNHQLNKLMLSPLVNRFVKRLLVVIAVTFPFVGSAAPVTLLTSSNVWKYLDDGVSQGTTWRDATFNDATWSNGVATLGYPPGEALPPGNVIRTPMNRFTLAAPTVQVITYYFRTKFVFTNDPGDVSLLVASNLLDDGAVFYLNGTELRRVALAGGAVTYNTTATRADDIGNARYDVFTIPVSSLVPGTNVIAVELHQGSATSSDAIFCMTLTAEVPAPSTLTITNQPQDTIVEELKFARFDVGVSGAGARYRWFRQDVGLISGATLNSLTLTNLSTNDTGSFYFAVVSNVVNVITTRLARLTVVPDTNGPVLLDADGSDSPTQILVSFSEPLSMLTATNVANYRVTNTLGSFVPVTSAVLANGTNVILTTSPGRIVNNNYILVVNGVRDIVPWRTNIIATNSMVPISLSATFIPLSGGSWYFWYGSSTAGEEPAGNWRDLVYDPVANNWAEGPAAFAYGTTEFPVATGTAIDIGLPAYYFRETFDFNASPANARLLLRHMVDDGALFYINGMEVHRTNLPAGTIRSNTLSSAAVDVPPISDEIELPISLLRRGSNALIVEVHQNNLNIQTDEDVAFAAELTAILKSLLVGPVVFTSHPQNQTVPESGTANFCATVVAASSFQWQRTNAGTGTFTNIPNATNVCLTVPFVPFSFNGTHFRMQATGTNGVAVSSSSARLTVITETNSPSLVSAFLGSNNTIVLSFNEPMGLPSSTTLANYRVNNSVGASVTVTAAALTNGTNVILSFGTTLADRYLVIVSNVTDAASLPNTIFPNPSAVTVGANYLTGMESGWKHLLTTNAAVHPVFTALAYDDSAWFGPSNALLYVEESGLPAAKNTLISLFDSTGVNRIITYYFRQKFVAPVTGTNVTFTIRHIIDDGMILHLNGQEIYRYNMPAGVVTSTTQASAPAVGNATLISPFPFAVTNLLGGTNVLAVEVHQNGGASSDIVMGLEVGIFIPSVITIVTNPPTPPCTPIVWTAPALNFQRTGTNLVLSWTNPTTNSCGSNALYRLQGALWLSNAPATIVWSNLSSVSPVVVGIPTNKVPTAFGHRFYRLNRQ